MKCSMQMQYVKLARLQNGLPFISILAVKIYYLAGRTTIWPIIRRVNERKYEQTYPCTTRGR